MQNTPNLKGSIFLSVKDLMILHGKNLLSDSLYESTRQEHKAIRECLSPGKRKLTVREYCEYEGLSFDEIASVLNLHR